MKSEKKTHHPISIASSLLVIVIGSLGLVSCGYPIGSFSGFFGGGYVMQNFSNVAIHQFQFNEATKSYRISLLLYNESQNPGPHSESSSLNSDFMKLEATISENNLNQMRAGNHLPFSQSGVPGLEVNLETQIKVGVKGIGEVDVAQQAVKGYMKLFVDPLPKNGQAIKSFQLDFNPVEFGQNQSLSGFIEETNFSVRTN